MSESLQKAISALQIQDVWMAASSAQLSDGFDPKYDDELSLLNYQFKHIVSRTEVATLSDNGDEEKSLFRVYIDLGVRWFLTDKKKSEELEESDLNIRAFVEASYVVEYEMTKPVDKESLNTFALQNASFHVWPYWREYLTSQCMRMNLPKLTLPMVQFADNRNDQE